MQRKISYSQRSENNSNIYFRFYIHISDYDAQLQHELTPFFLRPSCPFRIRVTGRASARPWISLTFLSAPMFHSGVNIGTVFLPTAKSTNFQSHNDVLLEYPRSVFLPQNPPRFFPQQTPITNFLRNFSKPRITSSVLSYYVNNCSITTWCSVL